MTDSELRSPPPSPPRRTSRTTIALGVFVVLEAIALGGVVWTMLGRGTSP